MAKEIYLNNLEKWQLTRKLDSILIILAIKR